MSSKPAGNNREFSSFRYVFREIFVTGVYESGDLPSRPSIVDIGANIGLASIWFQLRYGGCSIVAIEADPSLAKLYRHNVVEQSTGAVLHEAAAAAAAGELDLFLGDPGSSLLSSTTHRGERHTAQARVPAIRVSDVMPQRVDLLKMDIEGGEWAVFDDIVSSGTITRVDRMTFEYHHHLGSDHDRLSEMLDMLTTQGFTYAIRTPSDHPGSSSFQAEPASFQDLMIYAHRR